MWTFLMKNGQLTKTGIAMIFSAGALVGGALGTLLTRGHFEKKALKEIELVREHYHRRDQNKRLDKGLRKDLRSTRLSSRTRITPRSRLSLKMALRWTWISPQPS